MGGRFDIVRGFPGRKRRGLSRLVLLLVAGGVLVGGLSAAGAFASSAAEGLGFTISGDAPMSMYPGGAPNPIDLAFSNPNDDSVTVSGLTVTIHSVSAPHATALLPCTTADYAVTQFGGGSSFSIPSGSSTLHSLAFAQSTWPTLRMIDNGHNQDGCFGATVSLSYSATGQDGPPDTTTSTPSGPGGTTTTTTTATPSATTPAASFVPPSAPGAKRPSILLAPTTQSIAHGGTATFKLTVTNSSGVKLTDVTVTDPLAPGCARTLGTMAAGATQTYTCTRSGVTAAFTDVATVTGTPPTGAKVTATTSARVKVAAFTPPQHPAIALRLTPATQTVTTVVRTHKSPTSTKISVTYPVAGFKIKVTNTGSDALHAVKVTDPLSPACARSLGTLAAGHSRTYRCVAAAVTGGFTNRAAVSGKDAKGGKVSAHAKAAVKVKRITGPTKTTTTTTTTSGVTVTKTKTKTGVTVTLSIPDVLFAFNQSTLEPSATRALLTVLKLLTVDYRTGHLVVTGYTDSIGSVAYNLGLSQRRATTVADWLEQHGIPTARITIAWKGKADPVASNATARGRQKNRRVTVTVKEGH